MTQLSGEHYDSAFDHLQDGFQLLDFNWTYLYVNMAMVQQCQQKQKEDLLGLTLLEKFPEAKDSAMFAHMKRAMDQRETVLEEQHYTFSDGTVKWFDVRIEPVPQGIFVISSDITSRKNAQLAHESYHRKLEEMLHMTSHRVRQPVAHILGVAQLLKFYQTKDADLKQMADAMSSSASLLDQFTRDLTYFIENSAKRIKNNLTVLVLFFTTPYSLDLLC